MLKGVKKATLKSTLAVFLILAAVLSLCLPLQAAGPAESPDENSTQAFQDNEEDTSIVSEEGCFPEELKSNLLFIKSDSGGNQRPDFGIQSSTANLFSDSFENSFPGNWDVASDGPGWGQTTYKAHTGSKSVWCAGSSMSPGSNYPENANTLMYTTIDLSAATSATLNIYTDLKTQIKTKTNSGDRFYVFAALDLDDDWYGTSFSGNTSGWEKLDFDLTKWYQGASAKKNFCGEPVVYIIFAFAENGDGITDKGVFLDDVTVTGKVSIPPDAPSDLEVEAISSKQVNLTWEDNSNNETGFEIERMKDGDAGFKKITKTKAEVTSYTDKSGLVAETDYIYRIRAVNTDGNSDYTDEEGTTTLTEPPSPPTLAAPKKGAKGLDLLPTLSWNEPKNGEAETYLVQISLDPKFSSLVLDDWTFDTFFEVPEFVLDWNTKYYWRVAAQNSEESTSDWSSVFNFKTAAGPPPEAPDMLEGEALPSKQIMLNWWDNSDDETGFYIERKKETETKFKQIKKIGADIEEYLDKSGLKEDTTYNYRVRAYNAGGNSEYTEIITVTTFPTPPNAPKITAPANSAVTDDLYPVLSWNEPTKGEADYYQVQVALDSKYVDIVIDDDMVFGTSYEIDGELDWNTKYYWRVRAVDYDEQTSPWATRNFKTPVED
jgi:hypothetical protein